MLNEPAVSKDVLQTGLQGLTLEGVTFAVGAVARPIAEGDDCGDVAAWWEREGRLFLCLVDGLGHGECARVAALAAVTSVRQQSLATLPAIIAQCDQDIRATRGVALGLAMLDPVARMMSFCGVGNIRALLLGCQQRRFTCGYGIVGAGFRNLIVETLPFGPGDTLIMASDGLPEQFMALDEWLAPCWSARRLAETLLEHWGVATDDAAVLVCQARAE